MSAHLMLEYLTKRGDWQRSSVDLKKKHDEISVSLFILLFISYHMHLLPMGPVLKLTFWGQNRG